MKVFPLFVLFFLSCSNVADTEQIDLRTERWTTDSGVEDLGEDASQDLAPTIYEGEPLFEIKVHTFNAQRYFDDICDSGSCGPNDYEVQLSKAEFEQRGLEIANKLKETNADIIVFQELEKRSCLDEIAKHLNMDGRAFGETNDDASLDVGIISKYDLDFSKGYRETFDLMLIPAGTRQFAREFLEAHFIVEGEKVIVFTAHFISKRSGNGPWREAEARGARDIMTIVAEENPGSLVVLGGDLNDVMESVPVQTFLENGIFNAAGNEETWTYEFSGYKMQIDHLIYRNFKNIELVEVEAFNKSEDFYISDHASLLGTFRVYK